MIGCVLSAEQTKINLRRLISNEGQEKANNPKGRVPRAMPVGECKGGGMRCRIDAWRRSYPDMERIERSIT